jgi:hypothetical protein
VIRAREGDRRLLRWLRWISGITSVVAWLALWLEVPIWHDAAQAAHEQPSSLPAADRADSRRADRYPAAVLLAATVAPLAFVTCRFVERRSGN